MPTRNKISVGLSAMMVISGLLLLLVFLWSANPVLAAAAKDPDLKLGYVDLQKALTESSAGKKAFASLKEEFNKKQQDLHKKEEELKEIQADLNKQGSVLSESARKDKEENYKRLLKDYKRYVGDSEQEIQAREKEYTERILKALVDVIQKYGQDKGFSMIWEKKGIIYAPDKVDLTNEIIKAYDGSKK